MRSTVCTDPEEEQHLSENDVIRRSVELIKREQPELGVIAKTTEVELRESEVALTTEILPHNNTQTTCF
jgi:hypothetical protein